MKAPVHRLASEESVGLVPFDLTKGTIVPCQVIDALPDGGGEVQCVMNAAQLREFVVDPVMAEKKAFTDHDPRLAEYASLRSEIQRAVKGAKLRNSTRYAQYLMEGLSGRRPFVTPQVTLYHPAPLEVIALRPGYDAVIIPFGDQLVSIDGETQFLARTHVLRAMPQTRGLNVKVVIHHGKSVAWARQAFHDLNVLEVKPSASLAITMDLMDPATRIARELIDECEVVRGRVSMLARQLAKNDPHHVVTMSALRTGVVTTILGRAGLASGTRPIAYLAEENEWDALRSSVVTAWDAIFGLLKEELQSDRRPYSIASAPAILAGIGVAAHHTMPSPPRATDLSYWPLEKVIGLLRDVSWSKKVARRAVEIAPWEGIAGKFTTKGAFTIGGPKEVGYAVAEAIVSPDTVPGRRVRLRSI